MTDDSLTCGTPYLLGEDDAIRLAKARRQSLDARERAAVVAAALRSDAAALLGPFASAVRSELVAESNRLEGYDWSTTQVRHAVKLHEELLRAPVHMMLTSLRSDARVLQALGLYRAHELAEEWAREGKRPREFELRQLHALVMPELQSAGQYKLAENAISGASHVPTNPGDVPEAMRQLAAWWAEGSGDAVLDAAVVHAWLTHIHPFDDGNGRMARLLANMALNQAGFPPLLITAAQDRGIYLDALAASDEGDILPLYDLFARVLLRSVKSMQKPGYVQMLVEDQLLSNERQRYDLWSRLRDSFSSELDQALSVVGLRMEIVGDLDLRSFALLAERDHAGNGWFAKIRVARNAYAPAPWLLWFGHMSTRAEQVFGSAVRYPAVFISQYDRDPSAIHPYRPRFVSHDELPAEIILRPGTAEPVCFRWEYDSEEHSLQQGARLLAQALVQRTA
jgi:Fic family protein